MSPHAESTRPGLAPTVPELGHAEPVRDQLSLHYPEVERRRPELLDVVAEAVALLAEGLHGRASATAGVRSPAYRRQQLRGEHSLSLVDLVQLASDAPEAVAGALGPVVALLGYQLAPRPGQPSSLLLTSARVSEAAGDAVSTTLRAVEDGSVTELEESEIARAATALERAAAELRAGAREVRRRGPAGRRSA